MTPGDYMSARAELLARPVDAGLAVGGARKLLVLLRASGRAEGGGRRGGGRLSRRLPALALDLCR